MTTLQEAVGLSEFDSDCLLKIFEANGVVTFADLENFPVRHGAKLCGHDIYSVIGAIGLIIKSGSSSLGDELPISAKQKAALAAAGIKTIEDVLDAGVEGLAEIKYIGPGTAEKVMATIQGENNEKDNQTE